MVNYDLNYVPTTCWSDASDGKYNLHHGIQALDPSDRLLGPAFTVKLPYGDNLELLKAITKAPKGSVIVVDSSGNESTAVIGDLYAASAKILGIAGFVIDGLVRDYQEIIDLKLPIFCRGHHTKSPKKKAEGSTECTIVCGGQIIHPGDMIIADANGVVAIPQSEFENTYLKALEKDQADEQKASQILADPSYASEYLNNLIERFS